MIGIIQVMHLMDLADQAGTAEGLPASAALSIVDVLCSRARLRPPACRYLHAQKPPPCETQNDHTHTHTQKFGVPHMGV